MPVCGIFGWLSSSLVTLIIPTLEAGASLRATLQALDAQTFRDFETVVVDNSGAGAARVPAAEFDVRVLENEENVGFGGAINQGAAESGSRYVATLNDDARPAPDWLERMIERAESEPSCGMIAPRIVLAADPSKLDSAGFLIYPDGVAKQRGHGRPAQDHSTEEEVFAPSGCAALYRRDMLDAIGWFDADYFLYVEDADVGLRGQWAGRRCLYVPEAAVEHDYSGSAGRASRLKAFYVERNRLWTALKCFPLRMWPLVPFYSAWRYLHHLRQAFSGGGLASDYRRGGENPLSLVLIVMAAHWRTLLALPALLSKRRAFRQAKTISAAEFVRMVNRFRASAAEVARQ